MTCSCEHPPAELPALLAALPALSTPFPTPDYPPAEWFERPSWLAAGQRITVTDDGQVAGYFYEAGQCIVHMHDACPQPSPTGYAAFHQQEVQTEEGAMVRVGAIGNVGGHASPFSDVSTAARHYADPSCQMIVCRAGDDEHGGWIAGALVPGLTHADVALVRRSALSGDWRPMPRQWFSAAGVRPNDPIGYDCIGPTLVTRPGLPLVRAFARAASAAPVLLGGLGGVSLTDDGGSTVRATLEDGTVVDLEPAQVAAATVVDPALLAASPAPPPPPAPGGGGGESADDAAAEQDVADRVTALEQQVAAMSDALAQVVEWVNGQTQSMAAAVDADLVPIDA